MRRQEAARNRPAWGPAARAAAIAAVLAAASVVRAQVGPAWTVPSAPESSTPSPPAATDPSPSSPPGAASREETQAAVPAAWHVVKRFDFDEARLGNDSDLPMYWYRFGGKDYPDFPLYAAGAWDRSFGYRSQESFRLELNGGNVGYFYQTNAITISPEGEYVITSMQENALHGWRLPEKTDLRMDGYPSKTRSFSWDKRGRWLATSGAESAIVWPFVGKLGPQGKAPLQPGQREALVTTVAFHPSDEVLAIGYADGAALVVRFADQLGMELDEPGEGAVTALAWSADGKRIAIGDEAGRGAIIDF